MSIHKNLILLALVAATGCDARSLGTSEANDTVLEAQRSEVCTAPGESRECGTHQGACIAGTQACVDNFWTVCTGE